LVIPYRSGSREDCFELESPKGVEEFNQDMVRSQAVGRELCMLEILCGGRMFQIGTVG
jgi:hypothetical protein